MSARRYTSEYKSLRPFIIEDIRRILGGSEGGGGAGGVAIIATHALSNTAIHTGQLAEGQATWAATKTALASHAADPDAHHARQHSIVGGDHTASGLTAGHVLRAASATTYAFAQLQHSDLGGVTADQHHAQQHNIVGGDHTVTGSQYQIVGATGTNTLGLLTPSASPGAAAAILRTTAAGLLTLKTLDVTDYLYVDGTLDFGVDTMYEDATYLQVAGSKAVRFGQNIGNANWTIYNAGGAGFTGNVDITNGGDLTVAASGIYAGNPVLFADSSGGNVGILCAPDPQFALDVNGPARAQYFIGPHAIQLKDALLIAHFDGPERGDAGEPNGHMGQVATVTGDIRYRRGKFGKALEASEATLNLLTNPSFETNTTGWSNYSNGAAAGTRARTDESAWDGYYSYRLSKTGGAAGDRWGASTTFAVTSGQAYAATVRVRLVDAAGVTGGVVVFRAETNVTAVQVTHATVDGEWTELTLRTTATATGTAGLYLWLHNCTAATAYIDAAQVTATGGERPFWGGSGASAVGSLTYASQPARWERFSMAGWVRLETSAYDRGRVLAVVEVRADNLNRYILLFDNTTDRLSAYVVGGGASATLVSNTAAAVRTWHHVALTASNGAIALYLNGAQVATGTLAGTPVGLATVYVATDAFGDTLNGMVDDLALINRALTATEVRAIYESNAPVFAESSVWSFRATPKGLVWADDEGLWMRDITGNPVLGIYGGEAAAKSWGGFSLAVGDVVIGYNAVGSAALLWDQSTGKFGFYGAGNTAPQVEIATDGSITAWSGYIGGPNGWTITTGQIKSANLTLLADPANASVLVGTGANLIGLATGAASGDVSLWAGSTHANRGAAPFRVTLGGALTATSGAVGGWTISSDQIASANLKLYAHPTDASLLVGTGTSLGGGLYALAGITNATAGTDIVQWAGKLHADRATAPYRLALNGALTSTSADITGAIKATSGYIGGITSGWAIASNQITSTGIGLYAGAAGTARLQVGSGSSGVGIISPASGSDVAIWAGADYTGRGSAKFRVQADGTLWVDQALLYRAAIDNTDVVAIYAGNRGVRLATDGQRFLLPSTSSMDIPTSTSAARWLADIDDTSITSADNYAGFVSYKNTSAVNAVDMLLQSFVGTTDSATYAARLVLQAQHSGSNSARLEVVSEANNGARYVAAYGVRFEIPEGSLGLKAISAPATWASGASIYVDTADGDLKVKFSNGTVKTLATN